MQVVRCRPRLERRELGILDVCLPLKLRFHDAYLALEFRFPDARLLPQFRFHHACLPLEFRFHRACLTLEFRLPDARLPLQLRFPGLRPPLQLRLPGSPVAPDLFLQDFLALVQLLHETRVQPSASRSLMRSSSMPASSASLERV